MTRWITAMFVLALLVGCAGTGPDRVVTLRYGTDPQIQKTLGPRTVTVFRFADVRGKEGDGDLRRVGGIYNAYGVRLARVTSPDPWPDVLAQFLASGLRQRGIDAVAAPDTEYAAGGRPITTQLALGGEIKNFSTEQRWASYQAHISGIVRLHGPAGVLVLEKQIVAKARGDEYGNPWFEYGQDPLANLLNAAIERFVRAVVTDKDVVAILTSQ
jgi:hypothetical protein